MNKTKKWSRVFIVILSLCVVLATLVIMLAPRLINTAAVRTGVSRWIAEKTDSRVAYQHADMHLSPRPHVRLSGISGRFPGLGSFRAGSVTVHLSLAPLLSGKIDIRKITVEDPEISLGITSDKDGPGDKTVDGILADLASALPALDISFERGRLGITGRDRKTFVLRDIAMRVSSGRGEITADIRTSADFARSIRAAARIKNMDSPEKISLVIEGTDVDIPLLRETASSLVQEQSTVMKVFSRLREGKIPEISMKMTGSDFGELGGLDDLAVRGRLRSGGISVAEADLTFTDVGGQFSVSDGTLAGTGLQGQMDAVRIEKGSLTLGLKGADAPFRLEADVRMEYARLPSVLDRFLKERPFPLDRLRPASGPVRGRMILGDTLTMFRKWEGNGRLRFDGSFTASTGPAVGLAFTVGPGEVEISRLTVREGRSNATLKIRSTPDTVRVSFAGRIGRKTADKLIDLPYLPHGFAEGDIEAFINRSDIMLSTARGSLAAEKMPLPLKDGPPLLFDRIRLKAEGSRFIIMSSDATLAGTPLSLKGSATISPGGVVLDLNASAERMRWEDLGALSAGGKDADSDKLPVTGLVRLKTGSFRYGRQSFGPVQAVISISKRLTRVRVVSASAAFGRAKAEVTGTMNLAGEDINLDMDVKAGDLAWDDLKSLLGPAGVQQEDRKGAATEGPPLSGRVRFSADSVSFGDRKTGPVRAAATLSPGLIRIDVPDLTYCGIRTPATIRMAGDEMHLDVRFTAAEGKLTSSFGCITRDRSDISGDFSLRGEVRGRGKGDQLVRSLEGSIDLRAGGGRIRKSALILKVYSLLNVSGYLSGNLTDLFREGISYRSIILKADIRNGRVIITEANLDAPSMEIVASGEIDLATEKVDIKMLATPLTTIDVVLGVIPLIGKYVRGSLISLPIMVEGDLKDPEVHYTATSRIGSGLVNLMKAAVEFPFTIIQPGEEGTSQPPAAGIQE